MGLRGSDFYGFRFRVSNSAQGTWLLEISRERFPDLVAGNAGERVSGSAFAEGSQELLV